MLAMGFLSRGAIRNQDADGAIRLRVGAIKTQQTNVERYRGYRVMKRSVAAIQRPTRSKIDGVRHSVLLVALAFTGALHAEESPAYQRFKGIAAEMAKFGMPVDIRGIKLTVTDPTHEEFLYGLMSAAAKQSGNEPEESRRARVVVGRFSSADGRIRLMASGSAGWSAGDALVAHELAHAFQHQRHPHLSRYRDDQTSEAWMIQACMLEGEARLAAILLQLSRRGGKLKDVEFSAADFNVRIGVAACGLRTAYLAGTRFMGERAQDRGIAELAELYVNRPASTEQILHPSKLGRDEPSPIRFPNLPKAALQREDTFGELHLRLNFASALDLQDALRAAIGWDGDRLRIYRTETGNEFTIWTSVWDREIDAIQAESATRKLWRGGTTLRRGRTVSWLHSSDELLRRKLVATFRNWDGSGELDAPSARLTTSIEDEAMRRCSVSHRLRDGRWHLPEVMVSIPVPDGWKLRRNRYGVRLRKDLEGPSPEIVVDSWPMSAFGDLKGLSEHLGRASHPLYWMGGAAISRIEHKGTEALLVRRHPMRGKRRTPYEYVELYVPSGGTVVRFWTMLLRRQSHSKEREEVVHAFTRFRVARE